MSTNQVCDKEVNSFEKQHRLIHLKSSKPGLAGNLKNSEILQEFGGEIIKNIYQRILFFTSKIFSWEGGVSFGSINAQKRARSNVFQMNSYFNKFLLSYAINCALSISTIILVPKLN